MIFDIKTITLVTMFIIFLCFGIYFILLKKDPKITPDTKCNCYGGCDSSMKCSSKKCLTPFVYDENTGECICPPGKTGNKCQCDENNIPDITADPCNGTGYVCGAKGWEYTRATNCAELNALNGGTENAFQNKCFNQICGNIQMSSPQNTFNLKCVNGAGQCIKGCPTQPLATDCQDCKPEDGKELSGICTCSPDTNYDWKCQKITGSKCQTNKPVGLCSDGQEPICMACGTDSYTWYCPGSENVSANCVINAYSLGKVDVGGNKSIYQRPSSEGAPIPVFPTIDNKRCLEGKQPFDTLSNTSYNGYKSLNSSPGFITRDSNDIVNFTSQNDPTNVIYNIKNVKKDDEGNLDSFQTTSETDLPLIYGLGCMTKTSDYCSGKGQFNQDCFNKSTKKKVPCPTTKTTDLIYKSNTGTCTCTDVGTAGKNCQYSNETTCNSHGTIVYDSTTDTATCVCNTGFFGPNCQYSRTSTCNGKGIPDAAGVCTCDTGYGGDKCQYTSTVRCFGLGTVKPNGNCDFDCNKVIPRCAECQNNLDIDPTGYNNITCKKSYTAANNSIPLFNTCTLKKPNDPTQTVYGCQVNKNQIAWTPYLSGVNFNKLEEKAPGAVCGFGKDSGFNTSGTCLPGGQRCKIRYNPSEAAANYDGVYCKQNIKSLMSNNNTTNIFSKSDECQIWSPLTNKCVSYTDNVSDLNTLSQSGLDDVSLASLGRNAINTYDAILIGSAKTAEIGGAIENNQNNRNIYFPPLYDNKFPILGPDNKYCTPGTARTGIETLIYPATDPNFSMDSACQPV